MLNNHQPLLVSVLLASMPCWRAATAQSHATPLPLAGCYALELGPWSPPLGGDSSFYAVPRRLVLDTAVAARGGWRLMPNIQYPNDRPFPGLPRWEVRGDSVVLSWSNGFTPTIIALRTRGTVLTGEAVALSDAHFIGEPPRPRASVTMRRQPCGPG